MTTTVGAMATVVEPLEHSNPMGLEKVKSLRAYAALLKRSESKGKVTMSGKALNQVAPDTYCGKDPELNFDKPSGFVVVSKSFIPNGISSAEIRTAATRELPDSASEDEIQDMEELIREVREKFMNACKSTLSVRLTAQIREMKIPFEKEQRICLNSKEVFAAYQSQEPTIELCDQIYQTHYSWFEKKGVKECILYSVMRSLKIWHCNDLQSERNKTPKTGTPKSSCFKTLLVNQMRQLRSKFTKDSRLNHGIRVTITEKGGRKENKKPRRNPQLGFVPSDYITGWGEAKHKEFCERNGFDAPVDHEVAIASYYSNSVPTMEMQSLMQPMPLMPGSKRISMDQETFDQPKPLNRAPPAMVLKKNHSARQSPSTSSPSENTIRAVMRSPLSANPSQLQNPNKKAPTKRLEQDATDHAKKRVTAKVTPTSTERVLKDRLKKSNQNLVATQKQLKEIETQSEATVENNTEVLSKTITKAVKAKERASQRKKEKERSLPQKNKVVTKKKAAKYAPEDEYNNNIVDICGFTKDVNGWWGLVVEESRSGQYEDRKEYVALDGLYAICEEEVELGTQSENWLVAFVRKNCRDTPYAVAKDIAERLMGSSVATVFPDISKHFKGAPVSKTPSPKQAKDVQELVRKCTVDHKDTNNFKAVDHPFYFAPEEKYSGVSCFACKNYFGTDENQAKDDYDPSSAIPLPSNKVPVFVCVDFELDRCLCGTILCNACFHHAVTSGSNSSKRKRAGGKFTKGGSDAGKSSRKARRR